MARARSTVEKPVRLTISVTPQVHLAFERLAAASGVSLSRCMGEWLGDTLDAVEHTAAMVERARAAPKLAMREMHAYALGLVDETGDLIRQISRKGELERAKASAVARKRSAGGGAGLSEPLTPPVSNTGGKVPEKGKKRRGT